MFHHPDQPSDAPRIHNLILIRYNMAPPAEWHEGAAPNLDPGWLNGRLALFRRFCLPSLVDQAGAGPVVLVYFDSRTPPEVIAAVAGEHDFLCPLRTSPEATTSAAMLAEAVRGVSEMLLRMAADGRLRHGDVVSTTRLDSDDAISDQHLALANAAYLAAGAPDDLYTYFPLGQQFIEDQSVYRLLRYPRNAFGTLYERWHGQPLQTVMHCQHTKILDAHSSVAVAGDQPHWCMVIHGGNVLNRPRGDAAQTGFFPVGAVRASLPQRSGT